jgi:predicted O-linked N-acetylglucosamine transferase (SPINDLY family)
MSWQSTAYEFLLQGNYAEVAQIYEQIIEQEPDNIANYWYLGLTYLLQEQEEAAQSTWLYAITQGTSEESELGTSELATILATEATRQESIKNYPLAWLIRVHLQEIESNSINNILHLIKLEIILDRFTPEQLNNWQAIELLKSSTVDTIDVNLLLRVLGKVLEFPALETVAFAEATLPHISQPENFVQTVMSVATRMGYDLQKPTYAADLTKICLNLFPQNPYLLNDLLSFYGLAKNHEEVVKTARQLYDSFEDNGSTNSLKVYMNHRLILTLLGSGAWLEIAPIVQRYKTLLSQTIQESPKVLEPLLRGRFLGIAVPLFYLEDNISENRYFTNHLAKIFQKNLSTWLTVPKKSTKKKMMNINKTLKIGYIGHTLRKHSVGWLSRWLFHYHDRANFKIAIYLINQPEDEMTQNWFRKNADIIHNFPREPEIIAQQIQKDGIDILIDLDSLTHNLTNQVMGLKPAPIQVTWLGFDASGMPAIDYFIADSYVLPDNAQDYYQEKIWRLPTTYVAVDEFEVGVQSLQREQLNIPKDAVVYLSVQSGLKRHPNTIRLQLKILQAVPNSYFLIKGTGDDKKIQELFIQIAQENEVDTGRLIFLQKDIDEETHRANLQIADVILDTYPYNGATTTLEVLWMGIPLVTKVGEQFAARNSYAFMKNVGLTEGIARTDEEYIEWGVKLGQDAQMRQHIRSKLKDSRQTSPLWNARQFTKDMENAYQKMWEKYCLK